MAGSIRQLPSGNWQLRAAAPPDPITGRRRIITETYVGSRRSAELRLAELVSKGRRTAGPGVITVDDVMAAWLELPRLSRATREKAKYALKHLPDAMRTARAGRLTGQDLDRLYRHLEAAGVGAPTIRNLHSVLGSAFGQALKWGTVDRNPVPLATPPREGRSRATGDVTDAQVQAFVDEAAKDPQQAVWLRLVLTTAARRSEVLAIRWSAIRGSKLTVRATIEQDTARTVKDHTKTHRDRTIALDDETVRLIRSWQTVQRERALACGVPLDPDPFLLSHDPSSAIPWRPDGATQLFGRLRVRAGVPNVRLHDLRHAAASFMLDSGVPVTAVSHRLGHANPRTTLKVYAHVLEGRDAVAADVLAERLTRAT